MKRIIVALLAFAVIFILCSCGKKFPVDFDAGSFSYEDILEYYADETAGIKRDGFVNTEKSKVADAEQAIELAKRECNVDYDTISVFYDSKSEIYYVSFYTEDMVGGDQSVFLNSDGITVLVIYGE